MGLSDEYANKALLILILMILTGAARTILTKVYFQLGFDDPLFVTILYVFGQSFALPLFFLLKLCRKEEHKTSKSRDEERGETTEQTDLDISLSGSESSLTERKSDSSDSSLEATDIEDQSDDQPKSAFDDTGEEQWVNKVPLWAKPIPSSFLRLLDTMFLSLSTLFLVASVAEMLVNGLEIIFSIFATRFLRRKEVTANKWYGAAILTAGVTLVGASDLLSETGTSKNFALGILFVTCKAIFRVLADILDEYWMHDTNFPPMLMIGTNSFYGFLMGLPLYLLVGPSMGYIASESLRAVFHSVESSLLTVLLLIVIFLAGIFTILAAFKTCVLTKNMFKGFRGLLVWIFGLIIFYSTSSDLGEPWQIPGSPLVLSGFSIMMGGLYVYSRA